MEGEREFCELKLSVSECEACEMECEGVQGL